MDDQGDYRIASDDKGVRIETQHNGEWKVAYYCASMESAQRNLAKCIERRKRWSEMSPEQRMKAILR